MNQNNTFAVWFLATWIIVGATGGFMALPLLLVFAGFGAGQSALAMMGLAALFWLAVLVLVAWYLAGVPLVHWLLRAETPVTLDLGRRE